MKWRSWRLLKAELEVQAAAQEISDLKRELYWFCTHMISLWVEGYKVLRWQFVKNYISFSESHFLPRAGDCQHLCFIIVQKNISMELNITACTRKLLIVHTVVFIVPHGCLNRRVTWCSLLFESLTYAKYCSSCVTISYSAEYKRLWSWAGSGFAACGFISDSVDNMFYWFLFFLLDHLTTT